METKLEWIRDPILDILVGYAIGPLPIPCELTCDAYCSGYSNPCAGEYCKVLCRPRS